MRSVVVGVARPDALDAMDAAGAPAAALLVATEEATRRGLPLQVVHAEHAVAETLVAAARTSALLVVGRGSVAVACVRSSWCPVLVVPEDGPRPGHRILVAVDGSAAALTALSWGAAQARECGRALAPVVVASDDGQPPAAFGHYRGGLDISGAVWHFVAEAGADDLEVHPVVLHGYVAEQLVGYARPDDLLVLGSSGRRTVAGLVVGSTSLAVVRAARCPVAVIRAGQARRELHQLAQGTRVPALRDVRH